MAYASEAEFRPGITAVLPRVEDYQPAYWAMYSAARRQSEIVLGRQTDVRQLVGEYGVAQAGGQILVDLPTWDVYLNDCWIIGGIHAKATFFLKTVLSYGTVYNAAQKNNPDPTRVLYVTTREISGLNLFGYSGTAGATPDPRGQKFTCTQPDLANAATFQAYTQHVQTVGGAARS